MKYDIDELIRKHSGNKTGTTTVQTAGNTAVSQNSKKSYSIDDIDALIAKRTGSPSQNTKSGKDTIEKYVSENLSQRKAAPETRDQFDKRVREQYAARPADQKRKSDEQIEKEYKNIIGSAKNDIEIEKALSYIMPGYTPQKFITTPEMEDAYNRLMAGEKAKIAGKEDALAAAEGNLATLKTNQQKGRQAQYLKDYEKNAQPADYSKLNVTPYSSTDEWKRGIELAGREGPLTDEEKAEAKALIKKLMITADESARAESADDMRELEKRDTLVGLLRDKSNVLGAISVGAMEGFPLGGKLINYIESRDTDQNLYDRYGDVALADLIYGKTASQRVKESYPAAYNISNVAANIGAFVATGSGVGALTSANAGFAALPKAAQAAINSGMTFGISGGISALNDVKSEDEWYREEARKKEYAESIGQEYVPQAYDPAKQAKDVAKQAGVGAASGGAGGALGSAVSGFTTKILFKYGLQNDLIPVAVAKGIDSVAFAGGKTLVSEVSKELMYPDTYNPDGKQIAKDLIIAFGFGAITSAINTAKVSAANKAEMEKLTTNYKYTYDSYKAYLKQNNGEINSKLYLEYLKASQGLRSFLASHQVAGAGKEVRDLYKFMDMVDDELIGKLNAASPSTGAPAAVPAIGGGLANPPANIAPVPALTAPQAPQGPIVSGAVNSPAGAPIEPAGGLASGQKHAPATKDGAGLGENGTRAFDALNKGDIPAEEFIPQFKRYYEAGKVGVPYEKIPENPYANPLTESEARNAYFAGVNDGGTNERKALNTTADVANLPPGLTPETGSEQALSPNTTLSEQEAPVKTGRATTIYSPYKGKAPAVDLDIKKGTALVPKAALDIAASEIAKARDNSTDGKTGVRKMLERFYNKLFDKKGGVRNIDVPGLTFDGEKYTVTLNKNVVGKVISDTNLTAEKLAVFEVIDDVIINGEYVGSGRYVRNGNKTKNTIRFDYFETASTINNQPYIITFDVEVYPGHNNYRTHKVINEINLTKLESGEVGPLPTAQSNSSGLINTIVSRDTNSVNNIVSEKEQKNASGPEGNHITPQLHEAEAGGIIEKKVERGSAVSGGQARNISGTQSQTGQRDSGTAGGIPEVKPGGKTESSRRRFEEIFRKTEEILSGKSVDSNDTSEMERGTGEAGKPEVSRDAREEYILDFTKSRTESGHIVSDEGQSAIAYRPNTDGKNNAVELFKNSGIKAVVSKGPFEVNFMGYTSKIYGAVTLNDDTVLISDEYDGDINNLHDHEEYHYIEKASPEISKNFNEVFEANLLENTEDFASLMTILNNDFSFESDADIKSQAANMLSEIKAYFVGTLAYDEQNLLRYYEAILRNFEAVRDAARQMQDAFRGRNNSDSGTPPGGGQVRKMRDDAAKEDKWTSARVGEERAPLRLPEIIEKIRHDFGISVTAGHVRGRNTLGAYNTVSEGIRTKTADSLPVVSHELGHHFDKTYGITNKLPQDIKKELLAQTDEGFLSQYKAKDRPGEGFAEYIRKYLKNREIAAIDYPLFTEHFISKIPVQQ